MPALALKDPAADAGKTAALVAQFAITTAQFLNTFAASCESRLCALDEKLHRLDVMLAIIEAKLNSIDGLPDVAHAGAADRIATEAEPPRDANAGELRPHDDPEEVDAPSQPPPMSQEVEHAQPAQPAEPPSAPPLPPPVAQADTISARQHPEYASYFSMVKYGVPLHSVQNKLRLEAPHLDPAVLATPDAQIGHVPNANLT